MRGVDDVASVFPLRLTGGIFAVYLQLPEADRKKLNKVKEALVVASPVYPFMAYEQFAARKLHYDESPNVFLAELQLLASLFGGMTDIGLACAFMARFSENVCQLLRARSWMESLVLKMVGVGEGDRIPKVKVVRRKLDGKEGRKVRKDRERLEGSKEVLVLGDFRIRYLDETFCEADRERRTTCCLPGAGVQDVVERYRRG